LAQGADELFLQLLQFSGFKGGLKGGVACGRISTREYVQMVKAFLTIEHAEADDQDPTKQPTTHLGLFPRLCQNYCVLGARVVTTSYVKCRRHVASHSELFHGFHPLSLGGTSDG
jgi:hypothetical protein